MSLAVVALSALVPGQVTHIAAPEPRALSRTSMAQADPPDAGTGPSVTPSAPEEPLGTPADEPRPGATTEAETTRADPPATVADDDADPSTFVREVDVLGVDGSQTPGFDVPPPSSGPCPTATTCKSHAVRPARFKTDETGQVNIEWKFNDEGRRGNLRAPEGLLESAMSWATKEWSRWNSNISFAYAGETTTMFGADGEDGSCDDGTNTVGWHQFSTAVIAAVYTCTDPKTNTVRDVDLALNVSQHWENITGEPESRHTFDIRSIVTHEIGHWLSLLDLYDGDSIAQTMMGNAEYGETRKRTLALGDVIGLQTIYPCGEGDICPRKGIVDD